MQHTVSIVVIEQTSYGCTIEIGCCRCDHLDVVSMSFKSPTDENLELPAKLRSEFQSYGSKWISRKYFSFDVFPRKNRVQPGYGDDVDTSHYKSTSQNEVELYKVLFVSKISIFFFFFNIIGKFSLIVYRPFYIQILLHHVESMTRLLAKTNDWNHL